MIGRADMAKNTFAKVVLDDTKKFFDGLNELVTKSVFVGIPSSNINREPAPGEKLTPNNAVIGYVQENGDPARNIPARPFLVPGIKSIQPEIITRLRAIGRAAMDGQPDKVKTLRMQLGIVAQRAIQKKITDGPFQPLSEVTLQRRASRKFGKGAAGARRGAKMELARRAQGLAAGTDFARPLIDTGQLRRAINYVIGPNRRRPAAIRAMTSGDMRAFVGTKD